MELSHKDIALVQVIDCSLVICNIALPFILQSNEVNGNYHMEKEELIKNLEEFGLEVGIIVTDCHMQVLGKLFLISYSIMMHGIWQKVYQIII